MYVAFFHGLLTSIDQYILLRFVCTITLQVWFVMEDDGYKACNTRSTSEWLSSNSWGIENASGKMNWYSLHRCISKISCRQGREFVRPSSWVEARMSDKPQILIYQLIRWHPYLPLFCPWLEWGVNTLIHLQILWFIEHHVIFKHSLSSSAMNWRPWTFSDLHTGTARGFIPGTRDLKLEDYYLIFSYDAFATQLHTGLCWNDQDSSLGLGWLLALFQI